MPAPSPAAPGLGELLRLERQRLGLSTTQVAEAVGVHQTTVSAWERGKQWSSIPEHASALADALEVEVESIQRLWWDAMGGYLAGVA